MSKLDYGYLETILRHTETGGAVDEWDLPYWRHLHWGLYDNAGTDDDSLAAYFAATVAMTDHVVDLGKVQAGARVLDVGCGLGGTLAHLRERGLEGDLVGLNIDERQVRRATQLVGSDPTRPISFMTGDGCRLPVADGSVDHVLAIECVFHFPSRKQFFKEAARVLRPGGTLALSDFLVQPGFLARRLADQRAGSAPRQAPESPPTPAVHPGGSPHQGGVAELVAARLEAEGFVGDQWYGFSARPLTSAGYERLGRGAGFDLLVDDDVTARTLNTYRAHQRMYEIGVAHGVVYDDDGSQAGLASDDGMAEAARKGEWQYHVLSFRRRE